MRPLAPALALSLAAAAACTPTSTTPKPDETPAAVAPAPAPFVADTVVIKVEAAGYAPLQVEALITRVLEPELTMIAGVTRVESVSRSGEAVFTLTLARGHDPFAARAAAVSRLQEVSSSLPNEAQTQVEADRGPPSQRLFFVLWPADPMQATRALETLRDAVYKLPGVSDLELCGERRNEVVVSIDPSRLGAYGVSAATVYRALRTAIDPFGLPSIRGPEVAPSPSELDSLGQVVVADVGDPPAKITLRDVATMTVGVATPECDAAGLDGASAIVGVVWLRPGAARSGVEEALRSEAQALSGSGLTVEVMSAPPITLRLQYLADDDRPGSGRAVARALGGRLGEGRPAGAVIRSLADHGGPAVDLELHLFTPDMRALEALERAILATPGLRLREVEGADRPPMVRARVMTDDLEVAQTVAQQVASLAGGVPGVLSSAVRDDVAPEIAVELRRERLAERGLDGADVLLAFQLARDGLRVGSLGTGAGGELVPVRLRLHTADRRPLPEDLAAMAITTGAGATVTLAEVADLRLTAEVREIRRVDRSRAAEVEVTIREGSVRDAVMDACATKLELPPGVVLLWE